MLTITSANTVLLSIQRSSPRSSPTLTSPIRRKKKQQEKRSTQSKHPRWKKKAQALMLLEAHILEMLRTMEFQSMVEVCRQQIRT